jgi:polyferredoxin
MTPAPLKAVPAPAESDDLYEVRRKIYPRAVTGLFAGWRWTLVWATQLLFYVLPWLSWNDRPAVLFDLLTRRFYLFGLVLYPQDFIYLTGLLIISAMSLFLFTAVAGRLWCGYACPQTVYTEIFMWIERKVEGDRPARMRLDREGRSLRKLGLKAAKHLLWIALALWTGLTFVSYFTPIRSLIGSVGNLALGPWETFWVLFYGFATYGNAGFMREQVCKYMCPYARFQSSMFDHDTMIITYDKARGEPRGASLEEGRCEGARAGRLRELQPVRRGLPDRHRHPQRPAVRVHRLRRLRGRLRPGHGPHELSARIDPLHTQNGLANHWTTSQIIAHALRPRVLVYSSILAAVTIALFAHMLTRVPLKVDVIRDRGSLGREVEDGMIENVYSLQIINTAEVGRKYKLSVSGIESARIASESEVEVPRAEARLLPVRVRITGGTAKPGTSKVVFQIEAVDDPAVAVREKSTFFVPR